MEHRYDRMLGCECGCPYGPQFYGENARLRKALEEIMAFDGPSLQGDPSGGCYKIAKRALKTVTEKPDCER